MYMYYSLLEEAFELIARARLQKSTDLTIIDQGPKKKIKQLYSEPHDHWISYLNIDLCHQYRISNTEAQTSFLRNIPSDKDRQEIARFTGQ